MRSRRALARYDDAMATVNYGTAVSILKINVKNVCMVAQAERKEVQNCTRRDQERKRALRYVLNSDHASADKIIRNAMTHAASATGDVPVMVVPTEEASLQGWGETRFGCRQGRRSRKSRTILV